MVAPDSAIDQAQTLAFADRALRDVSAFMVTTLSALGDRLGLFKELAEHGPATSGELATRTGIDERYAREWLGGMTAAGYLTHDVATGRFTLPREHAPILAQEGGPFFMGGGYALLLAEIGQLDRIEDAFRSGRGVPLASYGKRLQQAQERYSTGWVENALTQVWIPAMPAVRSKLERGAAVADVGCGGGLALIKLAQAFPNSYYVGYDAFEPAIVRATENARRAGVSDRVRFQQLDGEGGLPAEYDVITTFDVVHDAAHPRQLLEAIRQSLKPDGIFVCLDMNCSDQLEENVGPIGAMMHGISVLYCLSTSIAHGGEGLGTLGLPEIKLRGLAAEAGFAAVRRVPMENPFNILYEISR
jgi:2-polyprenyl-3-methyl-5-hydroxy-6-metoxy-1,4-benzoquinol methylase